MSTITDIYKDIAHYITENIGDINWNEARLQIELEGNSVGLKGFYDDDKRYDAPANFLFGKKILELHQITTEGGHNRWNRAVFKLWPDGKFDLEFIWDQELHDEIERLNNE